jgi:hypothetical protein
MNEVSQKSDVTTQLRFIYNNYRTTLLNRKYYGARLNTYQKFNTIFELLIAIGAAGSGGVAGLAIWGSISGQYAWLGISGIATILGVIKPVLQLGQKIENYTKLYTGHSRIYLELKSMVEDIEILRTIPSNIKERYESIRKEIVELGGIDDLSPDKTFIKKLQADVNEEIPPDSLWYPLEP